MGTLSYAIRRVLLAIPTLLGITMVTFAIICAAPGDPAQLQAAEAMKPEQSARIVAELRKRFHLDKPIPVRYALWMRDVISGDLGKSMADDQPVVRKIGEAMWPTISVNLAALAVSFVLAIPLGVWSAWRQNGWIDRGSGVVLYALYSIPSYVGAIVLVLFVSVKWNLLPFRGMHGDGYERLGALGRTADLLRHMALYVVCSAYGSIAYYARFLRSNTLEVTRQDYVRTAKAKGLTDGVVLWRHVFRNTLIPFITLVGLVFPVLISGSVILEVIFTWPGLGRLFFTSVLQRDYPVIMALNTATALLVLAGTLFADLLYVVVDPRVSHG
ncbi:MAG: ABC transporter permease [Acidobacteriota bacterium]